MSQRVSPYALTGVLVLIACYGYFLPRVENVNSTSRMNLVYAIADQGTIRIDDYHKNTIDKAFFEGHYYTEKSIGPSLVALPVYVAFREVAVRTGLTEPPETYTPGGGYTLRYHAMALTAVSFITVSVPSAAAATLLFFFARRWVRPPAALAAMLVYGLGTLAFPYSSQFYSHQMAASAMFAAFFLLWRVVKEEGRPREAWLAGSLVGLAVITEYITIVLALLLLVWTVYHQRRLGTAARVSVSALPWGLVAAAYHLAAFGTPLPVGYTHAVHFADVHAQGFMGLTTPTWTALYGITLSPYRGLLFLSPVLVLSLLGLCLMWRAGQRSVVVLVAVWSASLVLYNASYVVWDGGYAIGPRHLVPMLPFACVPLAWALERASSHLALRVTAWALGAVSVLGVWLQTVGGWDFPPDTIERPLTQYSLPRFLEGDLALNLGMALGLEGHASLLPWAIVVAALLVVTPRIVARAQRDRACNGPESRDS